MNPVIRLMMFALMMLVLILGGYLAATGLFQHPPGQNLTESAISIVFWPTMALQLIVSVRALSRRFKAGEITPGVTLREWGKQATSNSFPLLWIVLLVRVVLISGILYDLTAFQGRYLDLLINGIVPEMPPAIAVLLLATTVAAGLYLPFVAVELDIALNLWASSRTRDATKKRLIRLALIVIRVALAAFVLVGAMRLVNGQLATSDWLGWLLMFAFAALGDWGLAFLHLGFYGEIWATIPYGIFLRLALSLLAISGTFLADWLMRMSEKRKRDAAAAT